MLAYAIFVTLLLGIMIGIAGTVFVAIKMEERTGRNVAKVMHPSNRFRVGPNPFRR